MFQVELRELSNPGYYLHLSDGRFIKLEKEDKIIPVGSSLRYEEKEATVKMYTSVAENGWWQQAGFTRLAIFICCLLTFLFLSSCTTWSKLPDQDRSLIIHIIADTARKAADLESVKGKDNLSLSNPTSIELSMSSDRLVSFLLTGAKTPEDINSIIALSQALNKINPNQAEHDSIQRSSISFPQIETAASIPSIPVPCITTDPRPSFCPRVPAPSLRPGNLPTNTPSGLDKGAIRFNSTTSCYEVLESDPTGQSQSFIWRNYNPILDFGSANKFSAIGPKWSLGHTSDDAFSFSFHYNELHPSSPMRYEDCLWIQYEYSRPLRESIKSQWCNSLPDPKPVACGGTGTTVINPPPANPPPIIPPIIPPDPPVNPPVVLPSDPSDPCPSCPSVLNSKCEPINPVLPPTPAPICPSGETCQGPDTPCSVPCPVTPCPPCQTCPDPVKCPECPAQVTCPACPICQVCPTCLTCPTCPVLSIPSDILDLLLNKSKWIDIGKGAKGKQIQKNLDKIRKWIVTQGLSQ